MRMKLASKNKTPEWTMEDLDVVLKGLKKNKSRDALGYLNELFRPEVIGDDLKLAILKLMNKIKEKQQYPTSLELCNISSIFKQKGSKNEFDQYRGIFRVLVFRAILERLIYNDEYANIDENSNVGARKKDELLYKYKGEVSVPPMEMVDDILTVQKCGSASRTINAEVNAFIEQTKLTLGHKKCVKIHIGSRCDECDNLFVHDKSINQSHEVKYLGDVLHENGKPKSTIMQRINRGYAIVGQIFALLKDLPIGHLRVQIGLELRQAWLINGMLFNSEVWHSVSESDIEQLVTIDKYLLRGLVKAHAKVPVEHLYLETSALPIPCIQ